MSQYVILGSLHQYRYNWKRLARGWEVYIPGRHILIKVVSGSEKAICISFGGCGYERLIDQTHLFPEALLHHRYISGQQNIDLSRVQILTPDISSCQLIYYKSHGHHMGLFQEYPTNAICIAFWSPLCRTARRRLLMYIGIVRFASCGIRTHWRGILRTIQMLVLLCHTALIGAP